MRGTSSSPRVSRRGLLLVAIASATLLNPLNSSMISVALPSIGDEFRLSFTQVSWLISVFYLTSAVAQPVTGKLGDLFGKRRVFFCGLGLVAVSSLLAPFSRTFLMLVALRAVQAMGSSVFFPVGTGIIRDVITERRASALGVLAVFSSTSASLGPSLGGLLVHLGDWQWIFFVNVPFLIVSSLLAARALPADGTGPSREGRPHLDVPGLLLFAAALASSIFFLLSLEHAPNLYAAVIAPASWVLFALRERRSPEPFVDLSRFFFSRTALFVHAQYVFINVVFYAVFFGMPTYLQRARGLDASTTGLVMFSIAGLGVVSTPLAGRVIDRYGPAPGLFVSAASVLAGTLLVFTIDAGASIAWTFFVLAFFGLGSGFGNLSLQNALLNVTPKGETGAASGLFMTSRYLGTILATVLLGLAFSSAVGTGELHLAAAALAVPAAALFPLALLTGNPKPARE